MIYLKKIYILIFWVGASKVMLAQTGQEFWFVAPDVSSGHSDRPIVFRVSCLDDPAVVTISQPANPAFNDSTFTLTSFETKSIDMTAQISEIENTPADSILNKGIKIYSTATITAYYEVKSNGYNTDIFSLKSDNALGMEFFIPAQTKWNISSAFTPLPFASFEIVATQNNTRVTIIPSEDIVGRVANTSYTITLDEGETYSARAASNDADKQLAGSIVRSDKPVAVTIMQDSGSNEDYGFCRDVMGDQLIPTEFIGTEYIVVKGFLRGDGNDQDDKVYLLATENNTQVFLDGDPVPVTTLNSAEQYEISLANEEIYITSSKKIYVLHITGFGCELGAAVLPSTYCTGSNSVTFTRSKSEDFYLMVLVPEGAENHFEINGSTNLLKQSNFSPVNGNTEWMFARVKYNTSNIATGSNHTIENDVAKFHVGIVNGGRKSGCMYGYFSDFKGVITDKIYHY